jgi:hypothetical protein
MEHNAAFYTDEPYCHGLVESKMWLCEEIEKLKNKTYDNVYVIGSWTGTAGLFLYVRNKVKFKKLTLVDNDPIATEYSWKILDSLRYQSKLSVLTMDCNQIDYSDGTNLVINASVDNIVGAGWFEKIPKGWTVAMQTRNGNHGDNLNPVESTMALALTYPLRKTLFVGELDFTYDVNGYTRSMMIGVK